MKRKFFGILAVVCFVFLFTNVVEAAPWNGTADTLWYTSAPNNTEYTITTAEQLAGLAVLVNRDTNRVDFAGKTVKLGNNINLNNLQWTPIGNHFPYYPSNGGFLGTFDGCNYSVTSLFIDNELYNQGLFSYTEGAVIKNLSVSGKITCRGTAGGIVGWHNGNGSIENCTSNVVISGDTRLGGIAGVSNSPISNCFTSGDITGSSQIGGITGFSGGNITNSSSSSKIIMAVYGGNTAVLVGGIAGANLGDSSIENCVFSGKIVAPVTDAPTFAREVGGIAGWNNGHISACRFAGIIESPVDHDYLQVGGIVGLNVNKGTVDGCSSSGKITGSGIVGMNYKGSLVENCVSTAEVVTAGIVGENDGIVRNCLFSGTASVPSNQPLNINGGGGIVLSNQTGIVANSVLAKNAIVSSDYPAGIVSGHQYVFGFMPEILNCTSEGKIYGKWGASGIFNYYYGKTTDCSFTGEVSGSEIQSGSAPYAIGHMGGSELENAKANHNTWLSSFGLLSGLEDINGETGNNVEYSSVSSMPVKSVLTSSFNIQSKVGLAHSISAVTYPVGASATGIKYKWTASNPTVASIVGSSTSKTVSVRANKNGTAKITLTATKTGWTAPLVVGCYVVVGAGSVSPDPVGEIKVDMFGGIIGRIDGNSLFSRSGAEISEQLISEQFMNSIAGSNYSKFNRVGFTADGNSRLLVRVQSSTPRTLSFNLDALRSLGIDVKALGSGTIQNPFSLNKVTSDIYQTTLVLTAPSKWIGDPRDGTVTTSLVLQDAPSAAVIQQIDIVKTPVVLVHGIWSDFEEFEKMEEQLEASGFTVHGDSYTPYMGPSEVIFKNNNNREGGAGQYFSQRFIDPVIRQLNGKRIEASKVDIVAHSMGGLMSRAFATTNYYKTDQNYYQGAFRRIITIGTPHWGAGFASYITGDTSYLSKKDLDTDTEAKETREKLLTAWLISLNFVKRLIFWEDWTPFFVSAISDLRLYSPLIQELNRHIFDVPTHLMIGISGEVVDIGAGMGVATHATEWSSKKGVVLSIYPYTHQDLYNKYPSINDPELSDGQVGVSSAEWSGSGVGKKSISALLHTKQTKNDDVIKRVAELLNGDISRFEKPTSSGTIPSSMTNKAGSFAPLSSLNNIEETVSSDILTISASALTVSPGGTVTFSVTTVDGSKLDHAGVVDDRGEFSDMAGSGNVFSCTVTIPNDFSGVKKFSAIGMTGEKVLVSNNTVSVVVKPDLSRLSEIYTKPDGEVACSVGYDFNLRVIGVLDNGVKYKLTAKELGTTYSSDNESVISVDENGKIQAQKAGEATVTVTNGSLSTEVEFTVNASEPAPTIPVDSVTVSPMTATIAVNGTRQLTATIDPSNATNQNVTWESDKTNIATVSSSGLVTAIAAGTATTITVTTVDGAKTATCTVTVTGGAVVVENVTVTPMNATMVAGTTQQLTAAVTPDNATDKSVTWSSGNTNFATVSSSGLVTAVAAGTTTITVKTTDGNKTASCTVTITGSVPPPDPKPNPKPTLPNGTPSNVEASIAVDVPDIKFVIDRLGSKFAESDFLVNGDGKVVIRREIIASVATNMLSDDKKVSQSEPLPVFTASVDIVGNVAAVAFDKQGSSLLASRPQDIRLLKLLTAKEGAWFSYTNTPSEFGDKKFTLQAEGNNAPYTGTISPNATYRLVLFIKDGESFDLDGKKDGSVIDPVAVVKVESKLNPTPESNAPVTGASGGSGCNAGYIALAFLFVVPLFMKRK